VKAAAATELDALLEWLQPFRRVLVAYSGGVDSALVLAAATRALGDGALACIGVSPSYPEREKLAAIAFVQSLGARYRLVDTNEHLDPSYRANPANRCYFCKTHLYDRLREIAASEGFDALLDGTQADDLAEERPGRAAGRERGVRSPLAELGFRKAAVRRLAREIGLPVWDKPAMACLSSRVPHGTAITPELLARIEAAECVLADLGFRQYRVRHHGELARIELPKPDFARAVERQTAIVAGLRAAGYRHVCLDLAGFRSEAAESDWVAVAGPLATRTPGSREE
jgi:uncharacterized protein